MSNESNKSQKKVYEVLESDRFRFDGKLPEIEPLSPLAELVFLRTYSRNGEQFRDTLKRGVEGSLTAIKRHQLRNGLSWDDGKGLDHGHRFFERLGQKKLLFPGRGMWAMGTSLVEKIGSLPLVNCAFVTTEDQPGITPESAFVSAMDLLMCGCGVGFDTRGTFWIYKPNYSSEIFRIPDSREGWCLALDRFLKAFFDPTSYSLPVFDFSLIREKGKEIKGFGGVSAGSEPLMNLFDSLFELFGNHLKELSRKSVNSQVIVDTFNLIGKCVVSGNVRRSAEIALGSYDDSDFASLKDPTALNQAYQLLSSDSTPESVKVPLQKFIANHPLTTHRWASNNSVIISQFTEVNYNSLAKRIIQNGEPGIYWEDNVRFNQMAIPGYRLDEDPAIGVNPCGEIPLEDHEICNVMDTFPVNHSNMHDWLESLKFAYMYCKSVTLIPTHNERINRKIISNRRIGISLAGLSEFFDAVPLKEAKEWLSTGYKYLRDLDKTYSRWLGVCESIRLTTVKPGGTIPLLTGLEGGLKIPTSRFYKRAIRISKNSPLIEPLREANFPIEESLTDKTSEVVYFPCKSTANRFCSDVPLWEQAERLTILQTLWADNSVSVTLQFQPHEKNQIHKILEYNCDKWKSVSFLPFEDHGYKQAPYTPMTQEEFEDMSFQIKKVDWSKIYNRKEVTKDQSDSYCSGDLCVIPEKSNSQKEESI